MKKGCIQLKESQTPPSLKLLGPLPSNLQLTWNCVKATKGNFGLHSGWENQAHGVCKEHLTLEIDPGSRESGTFSQEMDHSQPLLCSSCALDQSCDFNDKIRSKSRAL